MSNIYVFIRKPEFDSAMEAMSTQHGFSFSSPTSITRDWNGGPRTSSESEVIYIIPLGTSLDSVGFPKNFIKIYSSIPRNASGARGLGKDAIRVTAYLFGGWRKAMRVYRVEGWQERVWQRIAAFMDSYRLDERADPVVEQCGAVAGSPSDYLNLLENPGVVNPAHSKQALLAAVYPGKCVYCGYEAHTLIPQVGMACVYHVDTVDGQPVLSFFSVI